jgi:hypothetical protein
MNEAEWLECIDPKPMLEFLKGKTSDRKLRLFACACCRRIAHVVSNEDIRTIADVSEKYADGINNSLDDACHRADSYSFHENRPITVIEAIALDAFICLGEAINVYGAFRDSAAVMGHLELARQNLTEEEESRPANRQGATIKMIWIQKGWKHEYIEQSRLLRDITGNPFQPVTIDPRWLSRTVVDLAHFIYDQKAFDKMPLMADELERAGCDNEEIIAHCLSKGPHAKGSWVVDLLTGKE